jgi:hypothetical protein
MPECEHIVCDPPYIHGAQCFSANRISNALVAPQLTICVILPFVRAKSTRAIVIMILLVLAAMACDAITPGDDSGPTVSLTTATPGGSLSVSLLTATVTPAPGQITTEPLESTLIGPVATATSAAQTAIAATATAAAPTPTIPGVFTAPAICPPYGSPTLPERPPAFTQYPEIIVQYLSAGGPSTILEATLRGWEAITETTGLVRADRDFTGDGVPEIFMVLVDPQYANLSPQPGDLYVFGCEEGAYRLLLQAGYAPDHGAPRIISADDINGNWLNDLVYTIPMCDNQVCTEQVRLVQWSMTLGNFSDLAHDDIIVPIPEIFVADRDEDGLGELIITNGALPDPEAGPPRIVTQVWHWDGVAYVLSETIAPQTPYRIHVVHDADAALETGDYEAALALYDQVITDDALLSWTLADERQYLTAYALYREVLIYAAQGNVGTAQTTLDRLTAEFASAQPGGDGGGGTEPPPGAAFVSLAEAFWGDFAINRNVSLACALAVAQSRLNPGALEVLNGFGYANRRYVPSDLCPLEATTLGDGP